MWSSCNGSKNVETTALEDMWWSLAIRVHEAGQLHQLRSMSHLRSGSNHRDWSGEGTGLGSFSGRLAHNVLADDNFAIPMTGMSWINWNKSSSDFSDFELLSWCSGSKHSHQVLTINSIGPVTHFSRPKMSMYKWFLSTTLLPEKQKDSMNIPGLEWRSSDYRVVVNILILPKIDSVGYCQQPCPPLTILYPRNEDKIGI